MKVYALVGPGGSGKSEIYKRCSDRIHKFKIMYANHDEMQLDNRLLVSKFSYLESWVNEIILTSRRNVRTCLSDRCPYDTAAYIASSEVWFNAMKIAMDELAGLGVNVSTVYVRSSISVVKERVSERLRSETWRLRYHEDDSDFIERTYEFFERYKDFWDFTVENMGTIDAAVESVEAILGAE